MPPPPEQRVPEILGLIQRGKIEEAARLCAEALRAQPHNPQARFASALIDRQRGRLHQALATLESLAAQLPQNPAIRAELASTQVLAGQAAKAIPNLRQLAASQPAQPFAHFWLGQAYLRNFQGVEAARCFERVRELNPGDVNVLQPLASAYLAAGRLRSAEEALRTLLSAQPDNLEALGTLAAAIEPQNRLADAGEIYRRMVELDPGYGPGLAGLARILQAEGKKDEARALLEPMLGTNPQPVVISTYAGLCSTPEQRSACLAAAKATIDDPTKIAQDRAGLCFAIARLLDAQSQHDEAFAMYIRGNDLYPKLYSRREKELFTDHVIRTFSKEALGSMPRARTGSARPIFILGMPRSGTTLVEQILSAHPDVHAAGELQEMRIIWRELAERLGGGLVTGFARLTQEDVDTAAARYLAFLGTLNADAPRVTDKMPHNFEQLGLINLLFPHARVIHCIRNPLDTCVSCYTIQFSLAHAYATDLAHLGHSYAEYERLMRHWRTALDVPMLDVVYEETIADTEAMARRIVEFVGLPWDDACLRFYEAERAVTTASWDQVRRPIYKSSVARWKRYERHLGPLIEALRAGGVALPDTE